MATENISDDEIMYIDDEDEEDSVSSDTSSNNSSTKHLEMPAIKLKKVTAQYMAEKERQSEIDKQTEKERQKQSEKKKNLEDVANEANKKSKAGPDEGEETKPFNFLDVEIMWDKRKRTIPVSEQRLLEWLMLNLEKKEDVYLSLPTLYNYYTETCQLEGINIVDIPVFNKHIREKFGTFFGFKEASPYKGLLKEKKKKEKKPVVQGETLNLKFKDIIEEVISTAGNPRKGLRFGTIKAAIIVKYPALRVDLYPKKLKHALDRGIRFSSMELVRGVGMCGFYRLPGEPTKEEEPEKKKKKPAESNEETEEQTNGAEEEKTEEEVSEPKKSRKRKIEEAEEDKEGEADKKQETKKGKSGNAKKKAQKRKKKPVEKYRSAAERHSNPEKVEDVFPLAITYQSDPKEASVNRIKAYVQKHYSDCPTERMKKALESGITKGLWEQVRGSGVGGSFRLLIDTFNPSRSATMDDRICQAIVAGHEPKQSSALLLKKYVMEYHPSLNTEAKPHLFKHALERACKKGKIRQLSGIGASGSFQLIEHFIPSPAILAGELEDSSDEEEVQEVEEIKDIYIPRPTQRGRSAGRVPAAKTPRGKKR